MQVRINGKPYDVPGRVNNLEELVVIMKLRKGNTLLKQNNQPVAWQQWPSTSVTDSDLIEILTFVGGG